MNGPRSNGPVRFCRHTRTFQRLDRSGRKLSNAEGYYPNSSRHRHHSHERTGYLDTDRFPPDPRIAACFVRRSHYTKFGQESRRQLTERDATEHTLPRWPSDNYRKFTILRESQCGPSTLALRGGSCRRSRRSRGTDRFPEEARVTWGVARRLGPRIRPVGALTVVAGTEQ